MAGLGVSARGSAAVRVTGLLCVPLALMACKTAGGEMVGRAFGAVALTVASGAIDNAIDQRQERRDQQRAARAEAQAAEWAREPEARPRATEDAHLTDDDPFNPPGEAPSDQGLRRAFDCMREELLGCAAEGAGRLVIEAEIDGSAGRAFRSRLFGAAASVADVDCVDRALTGLRFEPFPGEADAYWTILYALPAARVSGRATPRSPRSTARSR